MKLRTLKYLLVLMLFPLVLPAQNREGSGIIELKHADELQGKQVAGEQARELLGHVNFQQYVREGGLVKVWTDRALQYLARNQVDLFGKVRVIRDSVVITSEQGKYFGNDRRVEVSGNVRLIRSGSVVTSDFGQYFPDEKRAVFTGSVHVRDSVSLLKADKLVYWEDESKSVATGHVSVVQLDDGTVVFGDTLTNYDARNLSIVEASPRLMQIDTSASGVIDTLIVESTRMESHNDSLRLLLALGKVRMARSNLAAVCENATFYVAGDRIALNGDPIVWNEGNQLTGDSITIVLENRRLHQVIVRGHAMAVSRADSVRRQRYDQLSGRNLTMTFADGKVTMIDVEQTATSVYYLYDDEKPNGLNRSSGDRIIIEFEDGQTSRLRVIRGAEGSYFPEKMIHLRELDYALDGFRWISMRPVRAGEKLEMKAVD